MSKMKVSSQNREVSNGRTIAGTGTEPESIILPDRRRCDDIGL